MNRILATASAAALMALTAPAAMAASILIDDFTTAQTVQSTSDGVVASSTDFGGSYAADSRFMSVETSPTVQFATDQNGDPVFGPTDGSKFESTGSSNTPVNTLRFTNISTLDEDTGAIGQYGTAILTYNFDSAIDLTDSDTNDRFFFKPLSFDLEGAIFTAEVTDSDGNTDSYFEAFGITFDPFLSFSEFSGVDFKNVTSLTFTFDTTPGTNPDGTTRDGVAAFDGSLASISVVPLPASALLLLGGLGGFAGVSAAAKRRRRKA